MPVHARTYQPASAARLFVDRALAAGAAAVGEPVTAGGRYQRGFVGPDGHQWSALCLVAREN